MNGQNDFSKYEERAEARFFAHVGAGRKVKDLADMPGNLIQLLIKTALMQFMCEYWGCIGYFRVLHLAPNDIERRRLEIIAGEEMGHARILAEGPLAHLGVNPYHCLAKTVTQQKEVLGVFKRPEILGRSWGDVLIFNRLQDASADMQLDEIAEGPYAPYCDALAKIKEEEVGHVEHGEQTVREYTRLRHGRMELQKALEFWLPEVLKVFGSAVGKSEAAYLKYGLKKLTNEESRNRFLASISPFFREVGYYHPLLVEDPLHSD